jgi:hypothetical protein
MRLLLAAVVLLLPLGVWEPLPAALGPVKGGRWCAFQDQGTRGETARVAFWGMTQSGQGLLQHREELMHPVVGLWLIHIKLQSVHRLQGIGLLIDQNKQEFVFKALQDAFGTAACAVLSWFTGTCQLVWIPFFIGPLKRRQQLVKLVQCSAGRC